jgi:hypothetical protein
MNAANAICNIDHEIDKSTMLLLQEMLVTFAGVTTELDEAAMLSGLSLPVATNALPPQADPNMASTVTELDAGNRTSERPSRDSPAGVVSLICEFSFSMVPAEEIPLDERIAVFSAVMNAGNISRTPSQIRGSSPSGTLSSFSPTFWDGFLRCYSLSFCSVCTDSRPDGASYCRRCGSSNESQWTTCRQTSAELQKHAKVTTNPALSFTHHPRESLVADPFGGLPRAWHD